MRIACIASIALAVLLLAPAPVQAKASASEAIASANKAGQVVFLVLTDGSAKNVDAARTAANEAQKQVKASTVVELDRSQAANAAIVKRYKLQAAPVPLVLVIAQNGVAVGASRADKGATERLVKMVPTPKKADMMLAFEQRKTAIVVFYRPKMVERSALFENLTEAMRTLKDKAQLVLVDFDDKAERKFIDEWEVPMKSVRPTIMIMNPKGQPLGRLVGTQTALKIVETASKKAPCCDDPSCAGCSDK
ncbi:MAG: hypothetical protein QNJ98_04280 [Planctomycetota bacterium]|nr:hypothetical protein [Planctomycetota bacterium]